MLRQLLGALGAGRTFLILNIIIHFQLLEVARLLAVLRLS